MSNIKYNKRQKELIEEWKAESLKILNLPPLPKGKLDNTRGNKLRYLYMDYAKKVNEASKNHS